MSDDEAAVLDAALKVIEAEIGVSESLKHKRHADKLKPIRRDAETLIDKFFARQLKELLKDLKPKLETLAAVSESAAIRHGRLWETKDDDAKDAAIDALPDGLIPIAVTPGMGIDYSKILAAAFEAGYSTLAEDLGSEEELSADATEGYLSEHSLMKLTGGLDETTVQRLRNALADAYKSGADYEGLVAAVKETYEGFSSVRSGMIAQTEMNNAYNAGRKQLGIDMGFNEKSWDPDATACIEVCLPNAMQGWIPMDEEFLSGDDTPSAHPNCDCSLNVRLNNDSDL